MINPHIQFICKSNFWAFCNYLYPNFYKPDRLYLIELCNVLQNLYEGKLLTKEGIPTKKLIINLPPRHGKSFTLVNFGQWLLGKDQTNKLFTVCYNENLSSRFSKGVRDGIETVSVDENYHCFADIFPNIKIKRGDGAYQLWALEGQYFNYLGGSIGGTLTGLGCNIGIIDDIIRGAKDALNDKFLDDLYNDFYCNTFLSRLEEGSYEILCFTRWVTNDPVGKILQKEPEKWYVHSVEVCDNDNNMICDEIMSYNTYVDKKSKIATEIFMANYHQQPIDLVGRMYSGIWRYYSELPQNLTINCYVDTADEGSDYLCAIIFGESKEKDLYLIDLIYSQKPMEVTEPQLAKLLIKHNVSKCKIESNNGGRVFARNVERLYKEFGGSKIDKIQWFHQNQNKETRIFVNSNSVQNKFVMPDNIATLHHEFWRDLNLYKKEGKNLHDDAPDTLTGCIEMVQTNRSWVR